jgi:glycerophosphoryl diester phosphodiesterase
MPANKPLVIAHRGASGYRPEHTLAAYTLAIEQGADFIEPDLVPTADGALIARHENELSGSTDVAARAEFGLRRTRKQVDGRLVDGWFAEDFTLAEIRTLRAREPLPTLRPHSAAHDGRHSIPTIDEVLELAERAGVGVYPETKHPTYFAQSGRRLDGRSIGIDITRALVDALRLRRFTDPARVFIQSFEVGNLLELREHLLPAASMRLPLVQLIGDVAARAGPESGPFDLAWQTGQGDDLQARYPGLPGSTDGATDWAALVSPAGLQWMAARYAAAIGIAKGSLLPRRPTTEPRADGIRHQLDGRVHPMLADAHAAGLGVHVYTLRAEPPYLTLDAHAEPMDIEAEARHLFALGVDAVFADHPDRALRARSPGR